jgi:hypothetical protein
MFFKIYINTVISQMEYIKEITSQYGHVIALSATHPWFTLD